MTDNAPERTAAIQQVLTLAEELYEALESQNSESILAAQQSLSTTAEAMWLMVEGDASLTAREKGVVRLLAGAAIRELPEKIKDPANYATIKKDLRLLKASVALL